MNIKITILGSGTSTGVPMVGCNCRGCNSTELKDKRSRSSAMLQYNGHTVLIDTSTDLRQQMLREKISQIDAVLFTHAHADHINGIDDLRGFHFLHKQVIPCYASTETLATLHKGFGYIFKEIDGSGYTPLLEAHYMLETFELFGQKITPIPLIHGKTLSVGFRIGNYAYLTDCSAIPSTSLSLLQGLEVLIIDGLRWNSHPSHFNIESVISATDSLKACRNVLTHLTHDVLFSESAKLPAGYEFAYDGMTFDGNLD